MNDNRIAALRARHAKLEADLAQELRRPAPNLATIKMIKRRKLAVKDELAGIETPPRRA